jgi:hypothetical protein
MDRKLIEDIKQIADHCTALRELDDRRPDEILGYDQRGLPRGDGGRLPCTDGARSVRVIPT